MTHAHAIRKKAEIIQTGLRDLCIYRRTRKTEDIRSIAGADASYSNTRVRAAVCVLGFPDLNLLDESVVTTRTAFPYISGLFAFREAPAVIKAFLQLSIRPDLLLCHGHGYAHPRFFGIASHIGVLLDVPTVGVAGNLMVGTVSEPAPKRGSTAPVYCNGEVIGMAVRTREGNRPVYVSAGHRTDLDQAVEIALKTTRSARFPEPLLAADRASRRYRARNREASGAARYNGW